MPVEFREPDLRGKKNSGAQFSPPQTRQKLANPSRIHEEVVGPAEPLIGPTREDYPSYYDYLSIIFSKVKQKPRVVEEHNGFSAVMAAVEAGTSVAIGSDVFGHSFGNRVKLLHITPEPKPISVGIAGPKGRLSLAAETFWQCAKEAT